jgi:hypothetical protein
MMTLSQRFDAKWMPEPTTGCHLWLGKSDGRYGRFWIGSRLDGTWRRSHRVAWELTHGPVPDGLHVLHRCDTPSCCNVAHLFIGTHDDNMADMAAKGRARTVNGVKTHCRRGHEYTPANTYVTKAGTRRCRACGPVYHARRRTT